MIFGLLFLTMKIVAESQNMLIMNFQRAFLYASPVKHLNVVCGAERGRPEWLYIILIYTNWMIIS